MSTHSSFANEAGGLLVGRFHRRSDRQSNKTLRWLAARSICAALVLFLSIVGLAHSGQPSSPDIRGRVLNGSGYPVAGATVSLQSSRGQGSLKTATDAQGRFSFQKQDAGTYKLFAETSDLRSNDVSVDLTDSTQQHTFDLVLNRALDSNKKQAPSPAGGIDFSDEPNFSVAGVTDWTAAGGHGSDANLRASEALTRDTLAMRDGSAPDKGSGAPGRLAEMEAALKEALSKEPQSFEANRKLGQFYLQQDQYSEAEPPLRTAFQIKAEDSANEYDLARACFGNNELSEARKHEVHLLAAAPSADVHRLAGLLDEKSGDPLSAVHEFETAATQDPSEQNYFELGSELLLHRAIWQAKEVFERGVKAHPRSERMLTGLGAALFAGALYDDAAQRLCDASDLNPRDPEPYLFMGRIEVAAPSPLACVKNKLARFEREQPDNSLANFFYAMAIWKDSGPALDDATQRQVQSLLTKAVQIDPKCSDGYLQLGNLSSSTHDYRQAINLYSKAIATNPDLSEAHYRLGVAYDRVGEKQKADREFQLHEQIEKEQKAAVEKQRREVKQFVVVVPSETNSTN
jgi:tetratricopeptide (TPR) repeat protein